MLVIFCWKLTIGVSTVQSQQTNTMYNPWCSDQLLYMFLLFQKDKNKIYELFSTLGKKNIQTIEVSYLFQHTIIYRIHTERFQIIKKWYKKVYTKKRQLFLSFYGNWIKRFCPRSSDLYGFLVVKLNLNIVVFLTLFIYC